MNAELESRLAAAPGMRAARGALGGREGVWIVGGTLRDALLERRLGDVDLAVAGDPEPVARAVAGATRGAVFPLSESFGAWRVMGREPRFVCDVAPLQGATIEEDLGSRDFTANAMALPLAGGELADPTGGRADLGAGILRVLGGPDVTDSAYASDPLRPLRLARLATELALQPDPTTAALTRMAARRVAEASSERVWGELRRLVSAPRVLEGLSLADDLGLLAVVLPELHALHGLQQSTFHHLDVFEHTLDALARLLDLEGDLGAVFGAQAEPLGALLAGPLADDLTRAQALRFAVIFHDMGKPATSAPRADGRGFAFIGHDRVGEEVVTALCRRLRTSERFRSFVGATTRHHLDLGFLVHERPLSRHTIYRYLTGTQPVEVEVGVLSCADRLATRGRNSERAIALHLELAREITAEALRWRESGPPRSPVRGDELAGALGLQRGPELGRLLRRLEEASFAGEVTAREDALEYARRVRDNPDS